jgi:hypothetical protein
LNLQERLDSHLEHAKAKEYKPQSVDVHVPLVIFRFPIQPGSRLSHGMSAALAALVSMNEKLIEMQGNAMVKAPTEYLGCPCFTTLAVSTAQSCNMLCNYRRVAFVFFCAGRTRRLCATTSSRAQRMIRS